MNDLPLEKGDKIPSYKGGYMKASEAEQAMASGMVADAQRRPSEMQEVVENTQQARRALQEALQGIGDAVETFTPLSDKYVRELRLFTAATTLEIKNVLRLCEDARKFFLDDRHTEEIRRLREFVDLAERLQALKNSGFLDTITETILKLHP